MISVSRESIGHVVVAHHHSGPHVRRRGTVRADGPVEAEDVEAGIGDRELALVWVHDVRQVVLHVPVVDQREA